MKFLIRFLLLLFLIFAQMKGKRRLSLREKDKTNLLYRYLIGVVSIYKVNSEIFEDCYERHVDWPKDGVEELRKLNSQEGYAIDLQMKELLPHFQDVSERLSNTLELICATKNSILNFFTKPKQRRRFFSSKKRAKAWVFDDFLSFSKLNIIKDLDGMLTGRIEVTNVNIDGIDWKTKRPDEIFKFLIDKYDDVLKPIFESFDKTKEISIGFFLKHSFNLKSRHLFKCLIKNKKLSQSVKKNMINFEKNFNELTSVIGWVKYIISLTCKWQDLKKTLNFVISGVKNYDREAKYELYGKFMGSVFMRIGNTKFFN